MDVILAQPRGFCAGVVRAVDIVELALERYRPPIYVLHEIVHNRHVVRDLERRGAIFVEDLDQVPRGARAIFSAHGVSRAITEHARERGLRVIDATCPLVAKVHMQGQRFSAQEREVIIIGHDGHVEVKGTRGRINGPVHVISSVEEVASLRVRDPRRVAYVTQTTLSLDDTRAVVEALKERFPEIQGPGLSDICYATQNRQNAVRAMATKIDVLLVVGARNSSNSNRLREVGEQAGARAYLVQDDEEIDPAWFSASTRVGVTAGASTPEVLVQRVLDRLRALGASSVRESGGATESIVFRLPSQLRRPPSAGEEG